MAAIVRSIKQALYSGEFKDTTGLAERQEVNIPAKVRKMMVYHGSGNDFDMFQTMRHLGEGEVANKRFNEELDAYVNHQMTKNDMLHLGMPSGVLAHFLPNLPMVIRQRILTKASVKKHNVDLLALRDMPKIMSHPVFIFQRAGNAIGILTEMKDRDGKNVCVAIDLAKTIQDGGETLEVNDIRSIHGREISDIVYPLLKNGTLKWVDKEKGLAYLSSASRHVQQEIDKQDLSSAAKIINDFENPVIKGENVSEPEVGARPAQGTATTTDENY